MDRHLQVALGRVGDHVRLGEQARPGSRATHVVDGDLQRASRAAGDGRGGLRLLLWVLPALRRRVAGSLLGQPRPSDDHRHGRDGSSNGEGHPAARGRASGAGTDLAASRPRDARPTRRRRAAAQRRGRRWVGRSVAGGCAVMRSPRGVGQVSTQGGCPTRGMALDGSGADPQRLGDLPLGEVEVVTQHEHLALSAGEPGQGVDHLATSYAVQQLVVGARPVGRRLGRVLGDDLEVAQHRTGAVDHRLPQVRRGIRHAVAAGRPMRR